MFEAEVVLGADARERRAERFATPDPVPQPAASMAVMPVPATRVEPLEPTSEELEALAAAGPDGYEGELEDRDQMGMFS